MWGGDGNGVVSLSEDLLLRAKISGSLEHSVVQYVVMSVGVVCRWGGGVWVYGVGLSFFLCGFTVA